jgi:beta-lactamase class D
VKIALFTIMVISFSIYVNSKDPFLEEYIKENKLNATVVVEELKSGQRIVFNSTRAKVQYLPASTFKIVNTLIALQEKIIKDEKEIIKWDGTDKGLAVWNKDQNLETAFPISCVWFFQELAKRVKDEKYHKYLKMMHYGNMKTGRAVDSFWLEGDLRISAIEQVEIVKKIYQNKHEFDKANYKILRQIMVVKKTNDYTIYAKTGWTTRVEPQIGWYVGYVETKNNVWFFACNLNIDRPDMAKYREQIIDQALKELGIIR